jgi:DNA-binding GntR family transcriptional regulator
MPAADDSSRYWSWQPAGAAGSSAAGRVYAAISTEIVSGELPAGSLITEGEVAERLGVSRTPVREAFLLLESQGLLRLFPKKGALVTAVEAAETEHLLQVRLMLESQAVRLGSVPEPERAEAREAAVADLRRILTRQQDASEQADPLAFAQADHLFHARVVASSGNPLIDDFYARLGPRLARLCCRVVRQHAAGLHQLIAEHARLLDLFAAADTGGYEELLRRHVHRTGPAAIL